MHRDSLGFLDGLDHVVALLLNGVHQETGQLVQLNALQKRWPGMDANILVGNAV